MTNYPYMTPRAGSKNLYFKRDYPKDIRLKLGEQIWRSLKSPDPKEAAKHYPVAALEFEEIVEKRRSNQIDASSNGMIIAPNIIGLSKTKTPTTQHLTAAMMRNICNHHFQTFYESEYARRNIIFNQMEENNKAFWNGEFIEHPDTEFYSYLTSADPWDLSDPPNSERLCDIVLEYCLYYETEQRLIKARLALNIGNWNEWGPVANNVLKKHGLTIDDKDELKLVRQLGHTEIDVLTDIVAEDGARFDAINEKLSENDPSLPQTQIGGGQLFSLLMSDYLAEGKVGGWPIKTQQRKETVLREFMEVAGDKPIKTYTSVDGDGFKKILMTLPANRKSKNFSGLDLKQAGEKANKLERSDTNTQIKRLNLSTINDKLTAIGTFFIWANKPGDPVTNPTAGIQIKAKRRGGKKRHPYNTDELAKIFGGKWYETGSWRKAKKGLQKPCAKFWLPLIGLYTGMLSGEIIQMRTADVKKIDGINYFDVTSTDDHENDADEKSLKTANRTRGIPIHSDLLRMGFLDFVEQQQKLNRVRLFPEYKRGSDGSWSRGFSKNYTLYRRELCGVRREGVDFYSFRHSMEDALRNANIPYDVRQAIQGREESGVSKEYGTGFYLKTLNDAIQKVKYDVDLSHLFE